MFYFREYTKNYIKNFPDASYTKQEQVYELFGKALSASFSSQLALISSTRDKQFQMNTGNICLVTILPENLRKEISLPLIKLAESSSPDYIIKPFRNNYYHISWLSLNFNYNDSFCSLLYRQMRSYDFLKLAEQLNNHNFIFNSLKEYSRKKGSSVFVLEPDKESLHQVLAFRDEILKTLHIKQPDKYLQMPPHISLIRVKNNTDSPLDPDKFINFNISPDLNNLTVLRNLNRIPDQPVFAVVRKNCELPFD